MSRENQEVIMPKPEGDAVELRISRHPSGRYTLKQRRSGKTLYEDLRGSLLGNQDKAEFNCAVSRLIDDLMKSGKVVTCKGIYAD
jgi:hypothetical protein